MLFVLFLKCQFLKLCRPVLCVINSAEMLSNKACFLMCGRLRLLTGVMLFVFVIQPKLMLYAGSVMSIYIDLFIALRLG